MIVMDTEFSSLDNGKAGLWQIGALEFENPKNTFLQEARIDDEDGVMEDSLLVTGKTEEELRDKKKQSQKQLIENFLEWCKKCKEKIVAGQNIGIDLSLIQNKCIRYGMHDKFRESIGFRAIDLHTVAQMKYKEKNGKFKTQENGKSDMNLTNILTEYGIEDKRMILQGSIVVKKGEPHNALTDAKLTAECLRRILK